MLIFFTSKQVKLKMVNKGIYLSHCNYKFVLPTKFY